MTDKIKRAKVGIVMEQPFFATLLLRKKFVADTAIKTAVTNGPVIRYNPEFLESLSFEELKGVICKQIMHTALLHPFRRDARDMNKWKIACDHAAGNFIHKAGMILPEDFFNAAYEDMAAEDIYKLLPKNDDEGNGQGEGGAGAGEGQPDQNPSDQDPNGCGSFEDAPLENRAQQEAEAKQETAQALQTAKQQGKEPLGADRIAEILEAKVPWEEVIARFLTEPARNDYSFSRPNVRYLQSGFVMPSLYSLEVGEIVIIVDSSASMDEDALNRVMSEAHAVASTFNAHITVIYVDTEVAGIQEIEPLDDFKPEPKGGGGTDFRPGFEWLKENGVAPKSIIYMTDGECDDFPEEEPDTPVLWAITGGNDFKPPFGEVIKID